MDKGIRTRQTAFARESGHHRRSQFNDSLAPALRPMPRPRVILHYGKTPIGFQYAITTCLECGAWRILPPRRSRRQLPSPSPIGQVVAGTWRTPWAAYGPAFQAAYLWDRARRRFPGWFPCRSGADLGSAGLMLESPPFLVPHPASLLEEVSQDLQLLFRVPRNQGFLCCSHRREPGGNLFGSRLY